MSEEAKLSDISKAEISKAYEEGKHRRYNLLFAVNGGAFAVAKLLSPTSGETSSVVEHPKPVRLWQLSQLFTNPEKISTPVVLGNLNLGLLSLGMTLFTIVMVLDIFVFGQKMHYKEKDLFEWQGKIVLILIGFLVSAGWTLVSFHTSVLVVVVLVYLGIILVVYHIMYLERYIERYIERRRQHQRKQHKQQEDSQQEDPRKAKPG
jgi:Ca2+/Na+ antiporter